MPWRANCSHGAQQPVVELVVGYLHRIARPLAVYLKEVVEGAKTLGILRSATAATVLSLIHI